MQAGRVNVRAKHRSVRIHEHVALAPRKEFRAVVAALGSYRPGAHDRFAVDHRPAGIRVASLRFAHRLRQTVVSFP